MENRSMPLYRKKNSDSLEMVLFVLVSVFVLLVSCLDLK